MEGSEANLPKIEDVPESVWKKLGTRKIYFGHQSVGYNIIDGINDLIKENPKIQIRIVDTKDAKDFSEAVFGHSKIGENRKPISKIDSFKRYMEEGLGERVDVAFIKFCYVDIERNTDVKEIFDRYIQVINSLKIKYPHVNFIHVTVPLTAPLSIVDRVKKIIKILIGRPVAAIEDNIKRDEYNELIKSEFKTKDQIFDLAAIESNFPDGHKAVFEHNGKKYPHLVPDYTYDGGHLNQVGRKILAEQLLIFIANL